MDNSDPTLTLDGNHVCNYCRSFAAHPEWYGKCNNGGKVWKYVLEQIKRAGEGKPYDCIVGASGGVDSSFVCYVAFHHELRPLLIHVDNGFDSEVSRRNIETILDHTGFDIMRPSVDPEEFRSVQLAYLRASVIDTDVPSDYLIEWFVRLSALKHKIRYVLGGGNYFADCFMPTAWTYPYKSDWINLRNIHSHFGNGVKLRTWPRYSALHLLWIDRSIRYVTPLNHVGYNRFEARAVLKKEWGWTDYGIGKHGENILSRFYQRHILPVKFGVDKRKANYSNYIRSGGMTRQDALLKLKEPMYDPEQFRRDKEFVLKKLRITEEMFEYFMRLPPRSHEEFGSSQWIFESIDRMKNLPVVGGVWHRLKRRKDVG